MRHQNFSNVKEIDPLLLPGLSALWDIERSPCAITALNQISQFNDISGNGRHLVQGTAGNQPYLSRADNQENRAIRSELLTTGWIAVSATINNATMFTVTGQGGRCTQVVSVVPGGTYTIRTLARAVSGNTALRIYASGAVTSTKAITVTNTLAEYTFDVTAGAVTSLSVGIDDNNAASWGQIEMTQFQVRATAADPTYITTTTYPHRRGLNGRKVLAFDGANDLLTSTATFADVFGAQSKTVIAVVRPAVGSATGRVFTGSGSPTNYYLGFAATNSAIVYNNDGAGDSSTGTVTINAPVVVATTHDAANQILFINGVQVDQDASGATGTMTDTLVIGQKPGGTEVFGGDLAALMVFNRPLQGWELYGVTRYYMRRFISLT